MTQPNADGLASQLPGLLATLVAAKRHGCRELTEDTVRGHLASRVPVAGVYAWWHTGSRAATYVGRTRNLAARIGVDHRSTDRNLAPLVKAIAKETGTNLKAARASMFCDYEVGWVQISDPNLRAIFEVYAAVALDAKYNSFEET